MISIASDEDLQSELNALIQDYGLVAVLETLNQLMEQRADRFTNTAPGADTEAEAFRDVARSLTVLIKALPPELDMAIALEQITQTTPDSDANSVSLNPPEELA